MDELTREAQKLLGSAYKEYLIRRKREVDRESSKLFDCDFYKSVSQLSQYSQDDISSFLCELRDAEYIEMYIDGGFELENKAIIILENKFKNDMKAILNFLTGLI